MLLPTVLPAAAQTTVGIRAGVGSAWLAVPRFRSAPCPPETHCPPAAPEAVRGLIFGGDLDIPVSDSSGVFGLRIGTAYAEKGGAGFRYDANGETRQRGGTLSTSYLQFSMLLRARTSGSLAPIILVGPWVASLLSCEKSDLAAICKGGDAGIAAGAGVQIALPGRSNASVGIEGIYYRGVRNHSEYDETTRLAAIQMRFVF
ncbi:MAG: hypothetical protein OXQ32_08085 [bacterium]|nr:hypothetical protein [bacterium]